MPEEGVNEVQVFGGRKGPYGDAIENRLRPGSYAGTFHMLVEEGQMAPFFKFTTIGNTWTETIKSKPIEWVDNNGDPIILLLSGTEVGTTPIVQAEIITSGGSRSIDELFSAGHTFYVNFKDLSLVFHSNGSTVPYVFACFGSDGGDDAAMFRNKAAIWVNCSGTPSKWDGAFSENGNLWVIINGFEVRNFAAGTNPASGTAGAAIPVGSSTYDITGAGLLSRRQIVFIKPDGLYVYDEEIDQFHNIFEGLARNPHVDTGKGTFTWGSNLVIPLGWGGAILLTRDLDILPISLLPSTAKPDHTIPGRQHIGSFAADAQYLYAVARPYGKKVGPALPDFMVATTEDFITFNDRTAVSIDNDPATFWTFADVDPDGANNFIVLGASIRFGFPWYLVKAVVKSGIGNYQYWDGDSWEGIGAEQDETARFSQSGSIIPSNANVGPLPSDWAPQIISGIDGTPRYYLRFSMGGVDTNTEIQEVRVSEDVALLPEGTNIEGDSQDQAGLFTHLFRGSFIDGRFEWDDIGAFNGDWTDGLLFTKLLAVAEDARTLFMCGPAGVQYLKVGLSGRPQEELYPDCTNVLMSTWRSPYSARTKQNEQAPTIQKFIQYVRIQAEDFDADNDIIEVWAQYDKQNPIFIGRLRSAPETLRVPPYDSSYGYRWRLIIGIQDGVRDRLVPKITNIIAGIKEIEEQPETVG